MKYDYLIVGQGLAGSVLAYQLLAEGKSITIINEKKSSTASSVAAGLINPITGPKMVKTWKADVLFPYLQKFYPSMEKAIGASFYSERSIYRPFSSNEELNDWDGKSAEDNYKKFIAKVHGPDSHIKNIRDPFGGIEVRGAALDMPKFIESSRHYLNSKCKYVEEPFEEDLLEFSEEEVAYQGLKVEKVVLCTGYQIKDSKFFGWIPMAPVKGEILHIKLKQKFETIYNKSGFIIPQKNGLFKAGSTYDRHDLTESPTESGKNEITKKLDALLRMEYEVVNHDAGIRPGTKARRPIIGCHPKHKRMSVFNGLGTKGVSLAPFFGDQLTKCLEGGNYLDSEVDIKKYYSLYFNSNFSL